ncbi:MAG: glucosyltransferase domain-containing protein [Clostridia bacterium]|nr:glucosyltransferase domain-containing protein [Clostridia bacterium]
MKKIKAYLAHPLARFAAAAMLAFLRFTYCGLRYFPQLDDYIQYHNYTSGRTVSQFWKTVERVGLLGARPLAGLGDLYLWSHFWDCMIIAILLMALMLAASAILFETVFKRYFRCGWCFIIIFTLLPLNIEGSYWLSASTRLVCGLFTASLSAYFLVKFCEKGSAWRAVLTLLFQTIAVFYYEQILVFSFTLNLLIGFCEWRRNRRLKPLLSLGGIGSVAFYFAFTSYFSGSSVYSSRAELVLPTSSYYFKHFLPEILGQIKTAFLDGGWMTLAKGFYRGIKMIITDGALLYALLMLLLAGIAAVMAYLGWHKFHTEHQNENRSEHTFPLGWQLLFALLIAAAPVSIFLVIANPWFSLRNTMPSIVGIALAADGIILYALEKLPSQKLSRAISAALVFFMTFACVTASASEVKDYALTWEHDNALAALIYNEYYNQDINDEPVLIFNVEPSYLEDQNFSWHEHIHGTTESSWALRGLINSRESDGDSQCVPMPIRDQLYKAWNYETMRPDRFEHFLYYDHELTALERVYLMTLDVGYYEIQREDGSALFRIREQDKIGYYEPVNSQ